MNGPVEGEERPYPTRKNRVIESEGETRPEPPVEGEWEAASAERLGARPWMVMGGGGLKGLAHVGAWQAVEEAGLPVRGIVGTSIGGLVGACVAGGMGWEEMAPLALRLERKEIARVNRGAVWVNGIRERSVFQGDVLREYIEGLLPVGEWSELSLPFQTNAVDLGTGRTEWFGPGARTDASLAAALYATCALPPFYPPAEVAGAYLVDGGVLETLPLERAAELGATGILAVDVGSAREGDAEKTVEQGLVAIAHRALGIGAGRHRRELVESWTEPPLLYVRPELGGHGTFDFDGVKYFLEEGYRATRAALMGG